jgi:hypothetical protein
MKRWQAIVNPGRWITTDESRVAGWYHSVMTIGPDPKPIRAGATLHTACITKGPLATYKLFARVYGGEGDDDINRRNQHTVTRLKTVLLFDFMLESFKGKGHSVVMDSAYMSDDMCLVGRYVWLFNFVGTVMANRTGAGFLAKESIKANEIVIGCHDLLLYQHNTHPLMYAVSVWADNNFVRTLSNFHSAIVVPNGIMRKCRDPITKVRAREPTEVNISEQQLDYCDTYYMIDKGNGAEAKYDLATESHLHGWLSLRYINMTSNNSYNFFCGLYNKYHPGRDPMELKDCINNATHSLLQEGDDIRQRSYGPPPSVTKDLSSSTSSDGRAIRSDAKNQPFTSPTPAHGTGATHAGTSSNTPGSAMSARSLHYQGVAFKKRKRDYISRVHQPMPMLMPYFCCQNYWLGVHSR